MKKLALALLLMQPMFLSAAPKVNPAEYTVTVHVISSHYVHGVGGGTQTLQTLIDGQQVELSGTGYGVLKLGDYHAARIKPGPYPRPNGYEDNAAYELLFSTGETRFFNVTGYSSVAP